MAETKTVKATAHVGVIVCDECGRAMLAEPKNARIQGKYIGTRDTVEEAVAMRLEEEKERFGQFAPIARR